jgi:hypothetical protein
MYLVIISLLSQPPPSFQRAHNAYFATNCVTYVSEQVLLIYQVYTRGLWGLHAPTYTNIPVPHTYENPM